MGALGAGLVGGLCGLLQLLAILFVETQQEDEKSGFHTSDTAFPLFALLVMAEIMCVMALAMYRVSPWVARACGDHAEAKRITQGKEKYGAVLQHSTVFATVLRRLVVMVDAGSFSSHVTLSLCIALAPLFLPKPKP